MFSIQKKIMHFTITNLYIVHECTWFLCLIKVIAFIFLSVRLFLFRLYPIFLFTKIALSRFFLNIKLHSLFYWFVIEFFFSIYYIENDWKFIRRKEVKLIFGIFELFIWICFGKFSSFIKIIFDNGENVLSIIVTSTPQTKNISLDIFCICAIFLSCLHLLIFSRLRLTLISTSEVRFFCLRTSC